LVAQALARFGGLTTVVANACGLPWLGASDTMPDDQLDHQFVTVFKSKVWLVNAALPPLIASGAGSIVFIGSGSAMETTTERNIYSCMRAAELQYMRNIAAEFGPRGVRINAISPGLIETFSSAPVFANEGVRAALAASMPLRRTGRAEEIAAAATFLASDSSGYTTGTLLPVDGGRLLRPQPKVLSEVYKGDSRAAVNTA